MQETRREFEAIEAPSCASLFKEKVTLFMDSSIDGYIAFLGQDSDSRVQAYFVDAQRWYREAITEAARLK